MYRTWLALHQAVSNHSANFTGTHLSIFIPVSTASRKVLLPTVICGIPVPFSIEDWALDRLKLRPWSLSTCDPFKTVCTFATLRANYLCRQVFADGFP